MTLHKNAPLGQIHIGYNYTFDNAADRVSVTGTYATTDIGKFARQLDDNSLWMLIGTTPDWVAISGLLSGELDGYASDITVSEHYNQHSAAINSVKKDMDGYVTAIHLIQNALDGYGITIDEHYTQQGLINNDITKTIDGYTGLGGEFPTAEIVIYPSSGVGTIPSSGGLLWADSPHLFFKNFGGTTYNITALLNGLNSTVIDHEAQFGDAIQTIRKDLDGYATTTDFAGMINTELEHYVQHSDVFQTIRKDLDGYALAATEDQRWIDHSEQIQDIRDVLIDGYADTQTVEEHYNQHSEAMQIILKDLDGYALASIENQRWIDSSEQIQDIRDALIDGYANTQTVEEHYNQHSAVIQTILKDLDGYGTGEGLVEVVFQENKAFWNNAIYHIARDMDGYASKVTEAEHYAQLSDALQTTLKDLDGYALTGHSHSDYAVLTTEDQRWSDSSEQRQDLRDAADGYSVYADTQPQIQDIRDAIDGYALDGYVTLGPNGEVTIDDDGYIVAQKAIHTAIGSMYVPTDSVQVDLSLTNAPVINLDACTGNCHISLDGAKAGYSGVLKVQNHATAAKTISWGDDVLFAGGTLVEITDTAGAIDLFSIFFDGVWYYVSQLADWKRPS